jgi:hypothetical protein
LIPASAARSCQYPLSALHRSPLPVISDILPLSRTHPKPAHVRVCAHLRLCPHKYTHTREKIQLLGMQLNGLVILTAFEDGPRLGK